MDMQILNLIGNTPILEIPHKKQEKVKIYAKLEWYNPSGSIKDRPAAAILLEAKQKGDLKNKTIIDATSGNMGISYAMLSSFLKVPLELALPDNVPEEFKNILKIYGAEVHYTSPIERIKGAQNVVYDIVKGNPDKYFFPDHYNNENTWKAHYFSTGPEIWFALSKKLTHFVSGLGTAGTFIGTSKFLKEKGIKCIAVVPDNYEHGIEGWQYIEKDKNPKIYDETLPDNILEMDTETTYRFAKAAASYLGILLSPSAAANLASAILVADELESGVIATIFPDNGFKYLKCPFWRDKTYTIKNPFF